MKKLVLWIAAILFILIGVGKLTGETYAEGSVSVAGASGRQGDTVDVGIVLNGNPGGLSTLELQVNYDSAVLECTGAQTTGLLAGGENISGARMTWIDPSASGSAANGTIGIVHFRIKDSAKIGASSVSVQIISSYKTDYSENPVSGGSGTVTVGCRNHSFGAWTVTAQPNCTAGGTQVHTCSACGYQESQAVPTLGHAFGGWTAVVKPTCTAGGREVRKCSRCQAEEARDTAVLGHAFGSPKMIKEPTETTAGLQESVCSRCGEIKQDILPKLKPETSEEETEETDETESSEAEETEESLNPEEASEETDQTSQADEDKELSENAADADEEHETEAEGDAPTEAPEHAEEESVSRGFFAGIGSFFRRIPEWFGKNITERIAGHEKCAGIIGIQGILNLLLIAAIIVLGILLSKRNKQLKALRNETVIEHIPFTEEQAEAETTEIREVSEETACVEAVEPEPIAASDETMQELPEGSAPDKSAVQTAASENSSKAGHRKSRKSRAHGQQKKGLN